MKDNKTKIRNQGFSKVVTIPLGICKTAKLNEGQEVRFEEREGCIVMIPEGVDFQKNK